MTSLQIALVLVGALCVALVWGFNYIQERQQRKQAQDIFRVQHPDALFAGLNENATALDMEQPPAEQVEPGFIEVHEKLRQTNDRQQQRQEPSIGAAAIPPAPARRPDPPVEYADIQIDWVLPIAFVESVSAPALWATQAIWAEQVAKPMVWSVFDEEAGLWRVLDGAEGGRYRHAVVALQLVDRNGPLTEDQVAAFVRGINLVAQQHFGDVDLPSEQAIIARADALDDFCLGVDVQVVTRVNIKPDAQIQDNAFKVYCDLLGLKIGTQGALYASDGAQDCVYTVHGAAPFSEDTLTQVRLAGTTLTYSLDVPHVAKGTRGFDGMIAAARRAAALFTGVVTDNRNHPLNDETITGIRQRISDIQERMAVRDILPGSPRAMRLFR